MNPRNWASASVLVAVGLCVVTLAPRADFVRLEDFEDLLLGPIHGQNGWVAVSEGSTVALDPADPGNQVLSVITESTHLHKEVLLLDGTVRMLFFRFRVGSQLSISFGLSDVTVPSRFDHFESELSLTNAAYELRINDGGTYDVLAILEPETWYNCWMLIDNFADQSQVWLHARAGEPATASDQLEWEGQTVFEFRNTTTGNNLVNYFIKTGGGSGVVGPLLLDDLYLETTDALNLGNPAKPVSGVADGGLTPGVRLDPGYPNPSGARTTFAFRLGDEMEVDLALFDAQGRRVATLASGLFGPQRYETTWSARDAAGVPVPAGVYFARLRAGDKVLTRTIQLIR